MITIYKYPVNPGINHVQTYAGAEFLSVLSQGNTIQCWALVDTNQMPETRQLYLAMTGEALQFQPGNLKFIGTVSYCWMIGHLFEVIV